MLVTGADLLWRPQPGNERERGHGMPVVDGWREMGHGRRWAVNWFLSDERAWPLAPRPARDQHQRDK